MVVVEDQDGLVAVAHEHFFGLKPGNVDLFQKFAVSYAVNLEADGGRRGQEVLGVFG